MPRFVLIMVPGVLLAFACATPHPPAPAPALPPLPRSSIAAVLEQQQALALTDEQIKRLTGLDNELARTNDAVRADAAKGKQQTNQTSTPENGEAGGARMGGGRGGRHRGGGASDAPRNPAIEGKLDDNDTHAYLEAEALLTEAQRPQARDIASKYREQLWTRRHAKRAAP